MREDSCKKRTSVVKMFSSVFVLMSQMVLGKGFWTENYISRRFSTVIARVHAIIEIILRVSKFVASYVCVYSLCGGLAAGGGFISNKLFQRVLGVSCFQTVCNEVF